MLQNVIDIEQRMSSLSGCKWYSVLFCSLTLHLSQAYIQYVKKQNISKLRFFYFFFNLGVSLASAKVCIHDSALRKTLGKTGIHAQEKPKVCLMFTRIILRNFGTTFLRGFSQQCHRRTILRSQTEVFNSSPRAVLHISYVSLRT